MPRKFLFGKYIVILLTEMKQIEIKKSDCTCEYVYEIQIQHRDSGMVAYDIDLEPAPRHILAMLLENNGRLINVTPENFVYSSYSKHLTALRNALGHTFFPRRMEKHTLEIFGYKEITDEPVNEPETEVQIPVQTTDILSLFSTIPCVQKAVECIVNNPFLTPCGSDAAAEIPECDSILTVLGVHSRSVLDMTGEFRESAERICQEFTQPEKNVLSLLSMLPSCKIDMQCALELFDRDILFNLQQRKVIFITADNRCIKIDFAYRMLFEYLNFTVQSFSVHRQWISALLELTKKGKITYTSTAHVILATDFEKHLNEEISLLIAFLKQWAKHSPQTLEHAEKICVRLENAVTQTEVTPTDYRVEGHEKIVNAIGKLIEEVRDLAGANQ